MVKFIIIKKIKKELESDFIFQTNSDTEVLLFSYIKWKKKMFDKIEGMYSIVIFNNSRNTLFFARDLFGQKPLYYFKDNNQIFFSSEIKPLLKAVNYKFKKINYNNKYCIHQKLHQHPVHLKQLLFYFY